MTVKANRDLADMVAHYLARLPEADRRRLATETVGEEEIEDMVARAIVIDRSMAKPRGDAQEEEGEYWIRLATLTIP